MADLERSAEKKKMQAEVSVPLSKLWRVSEAIFSDGSPIVFEGRSNADEELRQFSSLVELDADIEMRLNGDDRFFSYAIHYPEAGGVLSHRRLDLIPEKNDGTAFRNAMRGLGLIHWQITLDDESAICRVAVNSRKRAESLLGDPALGDPKRWDWKLIERHGRRMIRVLKKPIKPPQTTRAFGPRV